MRRIRSFGIAALLVFLTVAPTASSAPMPAGVAAILESVESGSATWGIYARNLATGETIVSHNAGKAFMPASNQKLLTSAAAFDALGADYRYKTRLLLDGSVSGSTIQGDLILVGSGDPSLGSIELGGADPLKKWARQLADAGVTQISGRIIGDDDVFDDRPYAEGWDLDYLVSQGSRSLGVSAGGLAYRDNVIEVRIASGKVGSPPEISARPDGYLDIQNEATTASRRRGWAISIDRDLGTETIHLHGSLPRSYEGTVALPVSNPTTFAIYNFKQYLEEAGIQVTDSLVDIDDLDDLPSYDDARLLFVHFSPRLETIMDVMNKESNNFFAEQVFRTMAYGGSAGGGERRIKELLGRAGYSGEEVAIMDGSGLSRKDLITPAAMVSLLAYMREHTQGEAYQNSLAGGGEAGSTLRSRLGDLPVQAKTGSLEYVRALSGYTQTAGGDPVAFSIFSNNFTGPSYAITQKIDEIVRAISSAPAG